MARVDCDIFGAIVSVYQFTIEETTMIQDFGDFQNPQRSTAEYKLF
jgi:hypothetical protein